jgi:inosine-uridine nucleoside N-ribohydrolase
MVGLDVTNQVFMDELTIKEISNHGSDQTNHLKVILPHYVDFLSRFYNKQGMPIHDSSAIAFLINSELFKTVNFPIVVETEGISRGKTWMGTSKTEDLNNPWSDRIGIDICMEVNSKEVIELIKNTLMKI